eukprot:TRINITY_DN13831_c0_g1_i1.p1 TRINITY_DN13831_c0_g1~~TRINITY_DN13831_c0_g1_i1.p1  ORF type:complete len:136 (+),score=21.26 TRINITY_DN13831_c0_g1_i1:129-536(+)
MNFGEKVDDIFHHQRKPKVDQQDLDTEVPNGDVMEGMKIYGSACAGCHALDDLSNMGPPLRDVYMRKVGVKKGFAYSKALGDGEKFFWTRKRLFQFIENPEEVIHDNAMFFEGLKDPWDRACVVEYLVFLKTHTV